jgi:cation diffusion facilitator CzcD-associated flavoprotein CzcO
MIQDVDHVDVLIVGAGLSGIGAAHHLQTECPDKSYAILEQRDAIGGTWDLFRYPGIRSDSDMYTLGYVFRPWPHAKSIADGPAILEYVRDTAREGGIDEKIRFHHKVVHASWSSAEARWTVECERTDTGESVSYSCSFLLGCCGYYRYDQGYNPEFPGRERFQGPVIHPQHWPEDLDYSGKRVVVIGSGATAVTLVPSMAKDAAHVTMLQRSPTWIVSLPAKDPVAQLLRKFLPNRLVYPIVRWKNVAMTMLSFRLSRKRPKVMKAFLRRGLQRSLPKGYDIDAHFKPSYNPWEQRLCLVPNGDLFQAIGRGDASVVTDTIETFTESGIKLSSGEELEADIIVTATGLDLIPAGGIEASVDGEPVVLPERLFYKGMMVEGVPNFAITVGYTNASWTLKCDLTCQYVCRLLNHMEAHGYASCTPVNHDPTVGEEPIIDFSSGYVQRAIHRFPKQGSRAPWRLHQNYARDILMLRHGSLEDGMEFAHPGAAAQTPSEPVAA